MTKQHADSEPGQPLGLPLNDQLGLAPERATMRLTLADLGVLADTAERNGTMHAFPAVALQWAAGAQAEIERLRAALVNESRRVCGTESDCVLQPHCSHAQKCMRPEWDAKA